MKSIVLIPTKNEEWILDVTLSSIHPFVDHIIVADQHSIDSTRGICRKYSKVTLIDNNEIGHSNKVRWALLDEARKIPGENLMLCIDADELLSKNAIETIKSRAVTEGPGTIFELPWIQLWKTVSQHRIDGVWKNSTKQAVFFDDRKMDYTRQFVINDHTARTPTGVQKKVISLPDCPLLHLQFIAWKKNEIKQAWYRCSELMKAPTKSRKINRKYSVALQTSKVVTEQTPPIWLENIPTDLDHKLTEVSDNFRLNEIKEWFNTKGILFFEPLQIWNIPALHDMFLEQVGRDPIPKTYPKWIERLADTKNHILKTIKS